MTKLIEISGQPMVHALGWTLLHFCWQGTLVAVVLGCLLKLLDARSARARYGASCLALGLMVALPLGTFAHLAADQYRSQSAFDGSAIVIDPGMTLQVGAGDVSAPWPARVAIVLDHALPWLLPVWFTGVVFFAARLNLGLMVARRMKRVATTTPPAELQHAFDALRRRLGIARAVRLMHSALVQVPTVIGWLSPVVLVPVSCLTGMSALQIEAVLAHELAHIRRHDYLVSVLQSVIETLLFYHPAVWWVSKHIRRERECCCDELAVAATGDRLVYARALTLLAEQRSTIPEFALGANGGVLTMRIKRLLGYGGASTASQLAAITMLTVLVAGVGGCIATMARAESGAGSGTSNAMVQMQQGPVTLAQNQAMAQRSDGQSGNAVTSRRQSSTGPAATTIVKTGGQPDMSCTYYGGVPFRGQGGTCEEDNAVAGQYSCRADDMRSVQSQPACEWKVKRLQEWQHKSQIEDAQRLLQNAQKNLNSREFKMQMQAAEQQLQNAQKKLNSEQFKKQMTQLVAQNAMVAKELVAKESGTQLAAQSSPAALSAASGAPMQVTGSEIQGNRIHKVDPVYPPIAKAAHVQGTVVLHATISKEGAIESLSVISGNAMLTSAAMDAVRQWTYKPYLMNGQPTEVETSITVNFTLPGSVAAVGPVPPADEAAEGVKQVGGDVTAPVPIYAPEPEYTQAGRKAKVEGVVTVGLIVDKNGMPQNVHLLRGLGIGPDGKPDPKLKKAARAAVDGMNQSAVDAVQQYKFKPAMENGQPVAVFENIEVNFKIF